MTDPAQTQEIAMVADPATRLLQLAQETADRYSTETREAADNYYVQRRAEGEQEAQRIIAEAQAAAAAEYRAQLRIHLQSQIDKIDAQVEGS